MQTLDQSELVSDASDKLANSTSTSSILVGFDGFVDEIIHMVDERKDKDTYSRINTMPALAKRIDAAAGYSCNIEMVPQMVKLGGNGPIMANALSRYDHGVTYIGAVGDGHVHPVFEDFAQSCEKVISLSDPAHTHALEFDDGKIMLGKMTNLAEVNWHNLMQKISVESMTDLLTRVDLVACVNWTMLPNMNSIFEGITGLLNTVKTRTQIFIDLTDPRKRPIEDIAEALSLLTNMQGDGDVILGMNEQESAQVAEVLDCAAAKDLLDRADAIRTKLNIHTSVIHPTASACVSDENGCFQVEGPFTSKPKLTTGAGDIFNSGFCHGLLVGLTAQEALCSGVCSSGYYVRNCRSAHRDELVDFMRIWADQGCGEI